MIVLCQHTSTDTFWGQSSSGRCDPFIEPNTRTTLHSDQQVAVVGRTADGFGGGFAAVFTLEVFVLLVTILTLKAVLRMVR